MVVDDGRPKWPDIWMALARSIARRSHSQRTKVGAVIVSDDNTRVLALGYNGDAAGLTNAPEASGPGLELCIHAEENAFVKLDYTDPARRVMYVTHAPCRMCSKLAIQARINEVVFEHEYRDMSGIELMEGVGIDVRQYVGEGMPLRRLDLGAASRLVSRRKHGRRKPKQPA